VWFEAADVAAIAGGSAPFASALPIDRALVDDVLIAYEMNEQPISAEHGAPLRLVVPGAIGARSVKWLTRITVADGASNSPFETDSYLFEVPGDDAPGLRLTDMPLNSYICAPREGDVIAASPTRVAGYATGGGVSAVKSVEISVDDGPWQPADLLDAPAPGVWVRWELLVADLGAGAHSLVVRATDATGAVQPPEVAARWNVRGYVNDAWHRILFVVAEHPVVDAVAV
jgi:sulfite oxidase